MIKKKKILINLLNYYIKMNGYGEYLETVIKFSEPLSETIQSEKILEKQNKIKIISLTLIPYDYLLNEFKKWTIPYDYLEFKKWTIPYDYLLNVFKKWTIIIDLNKDNKDEIFPEIKYGLENKADNYYEIYKDENEIYNEKFKKYIKFKNKVLDYINAQIGNIKLNKIIKLEIFPVKNELGIYDENDFYNFKNIQCISSFQYKGKEYKYKDDNIFVNGIYGKAPGFIFLINALIEDYLDFTQ